jgi:tetratricopeptide (TPR) repeat protein
MSAWPNTTRSGRETGLAARTWFASSTAARSSASRSRAKISSAYSFMSITLLSMRVIADHTYALAGRASKGSSILQEAVDEAERLGNVSGQASRLASLGEALLLGGRPDEAATKADQALAQSRRRGERGHEAWTLRLQGEAAAAQPGARRGEASERFREALALAAALEMRPLDARCHLGLAALHQAEGRIDEACAARGHAIEMLRSMGMNFWLTQAQGLRIGGHQSIHHE